MLRDVRYWQSTMPEIISPNPDADLIDRLTRLVAAGF
jgi:hypothetical protein